MQTNLEKCGNLAVPVDESGTATGRPEPYQDKTMETKHTKGPWQCHSGIVWALSVPPTEANEEVPIARIERNSHFTTPTETDANARLIACAPELLDVAELVVWMFSGETERSGHLDGLIKQAEAAIAKAKGTAL